MHGGGLAAAFETTSPISFCASMAMSWPILPRLPVTSDSQPASSARIVARVVPASIGRRQIELSALRRPRAPAPYRRTCPACRPARRTAAPAGAASAPASRGWCRASGARQAAIRSPQVIGKRALHAGARHRGLSCHASCASASSRASTCSSRRPRIERRFQAQHEAGIEYVLAGRSEMDMLAMRRADMPAQLLDPVRHHHAVARRPRRARPCPAGRPAPPRRSPALRRWG